MPKFHDMPILGREELADAVSELRGCGAGDSFEAAQAVKDLGKTLNMFERNTRRLRCSTPRSAKDFGKVLGSWPRSFASATGFVDPEEFEMVPGDVPGCLRRRARERMDENGELPGHLAACCSWCAGGC